MRKRAELYGQEKRCNPAVSCCCTTSGFTLRVELVLESQIHDRAAYAASCLVPVRRSIVVSSSAAHCFPLPQFDSAGGARVERGCTGVVGAVGRRAGSFVRAERDSARFDAFAAVEWRGAAVRLVAALDDGGAFADGH